MANTISFISLRLNYCNSLAYGISDNLLRRLQAVQNAASRVVTGTRRRDHITPVLQQLYIGCQLAVLVYKALNNMAPQYLTDDCQLLTAGHRQASTPVVRDLQGFSESVLVSAIVHSPPPHHDYGTICPYTSVGH